MSAPLPLIHDLNREELRSVCADLNQPSYRADQIWRWLYVERAADWQAMKNIPAALRDRLAETFSLTYAAPSSVLGKPHQTRKILVRLTDGHVVEQAVIPAPDRNTVCVSSQVGCRFNCAFCASGKAGLKRNLATGEIVGQVLLAADLLEKLPTHVVFMGVGEPFDNYDAALAAVRIINDKDGIGIGARRITISTSGVIPGIRRMAGEGLQVELSVSLHAPTSALRETLMPIEKIYPLHSVLAACREFSRATGRIVTFEYTLIRNVNDSHEQAEALARLLAPLPCRVNLIPLSEIEEYAGKPGTRRTAGMFIETLRASRINATLRESKGAPLKAACGQLRIDHISM